LEKGPVKGMGTKVVDFMILAQNLGMEKWSNFDLFCGLIL